MAHHSRLPVTVLEMGEALSILADAFDAGLDVGVQRLLVDESNAPPRRSRRLVRQSSSAPHPLVA